jgi:hypothetical protein
MDESESELDPIEAHFDAVDARIEELCDGPLKPRIEALEADRQKVRGIIIRSIQVLAVPILLFFFAEDVAALLAAAAGDVAVVRWLADNMIAVSVGLFLLAMVYIGLVIAMPGITAYMNYRLRFKNELVGEVFRTLAPSGAYQPDHHITKAVFQTSGLWTGEFPDLEGVPGFTGDDLIRGRIGATEFEACDLSALGAFRIQRRRRRELITRRPNATLFSGLFFHIGLDRALRGHTIVEPEVTDGRLSGHRSGFQQIDLGDPAFAEGFRVYTTDPAEAAELLNPRVRGRLLKLADHLSNYPFLAFVGHHMFFAIHSGLPMLEPTIAKPSSYATLSVIAEFFALPELLVRELAPGAAGAGGFTASSPLAAAPQAPAILAQPAAEGIGAALAGARSRLAAIGVDGDAITQDHVAELVMQRADERDLALRPPPESRVRLSPLTGEGLVVSYGLESSFFVRVLWTLALTPFAIGGFARLVGEAGAPTLAALAGQVPGVAFVAEQAALWPVAFTLIALVFYVLPTWGLFQLPSGLQIGRDGVRVNRRLWPIAKLHRFDRLSSVRVTDRQVALQRKNASLLRRYVFPAPPMPTNEDARWLGAHLRRAMVMFGGLREER